MKKAALLLLFSLIFLGTSSLACHLKFGAVPQFDQRKLLSIWTPILDGLEAETGCKIEVIGSHDIPAFEENFLNGVYDIAYMNPFHAVMAQKAQSYTPIVHSGAKKLSGILVTRKNGGAKDVSELEGQQIAFPSPNALGASLLMRAELREREGLNFQPKYVKTHNSVYLHVAKGLLPAGGGVMRTFKQQPEELKNLLTILYKTSPSPAHPIVIHPRVGVELSAKIQKSLLEIAETKPDLFDAIPMKSPKKTDFQDFAPLEKLEKYQTKKRP